MIKDLNQTQRDSEFMKALFDAGIDKYGMDMQKLEEPFLEAVRPALEKRGLVGNAGRSMFWEAISYEMLDYGSACEFEGFRLGFSIALELIFGKDELGLKEA